MKPKQAIKHLEFIAENQQTVSTNRIKDMVQVISSHQKMLEKDNRRLRRRIKRQRKALRRIENKFQEETT